MTVDNVPVLHSFPSFHNWWHLYANLQVLQLLTHLN